MQLKLTDNSSSSSNQDDGKYQSFTQKWIICKVSCVIYAWNDNT